MNNQLLQWVVIETKCKFDDKEKEHIKTLMSLINTIQE